MSTRSLNKVMLIGNLTRDVDLRYTPSGTAVATFGLATNRGWTTDAGERNEDVQFHRIVAWSKLAEICNQLLFKGRKVFIEGRLQTRKWTGQDGQQRETTEIVAENMMILDTKQRDGGVVNTNGYTANPDAQPTMPTPAPIADDKVVIVDDDKVDVKKGKVQDKKDVVEPKTDAKKTEKEQLDEVNVEDIPF